MASIPGRGAQANPANRFELITYERIEDDGTPDACAPTTQFLRDSSRSLISTNDSPDVGFDASINPYRGCEHGCIYCYARPTHEYLGFSAGLDFESKILVKENAPELLRRELASPRWQPKVLGISGVTDAYQPIERRLQLTRRCLEVLAEFRNPAVIVTKNHLVTRDADILKELSQHKAIAVFISLATLDADLAGKLEPRASRPQGRLDAIRELADAGVPVGVLAAPIIPGLNDHEMPAVLAAAREAGAEYAGYTMLRLPFGLAALFEDWLALHYPDRKEKVLGRIRDVRGGKLNDSNFATRMRGQGEMADLLHNLFKLTRNRVGMRGRAPALSAAAFRVPNASYQPTLFE